MLAVVVRLEIMIVTFLSKGKNQQQQELAEDFRERRESRRGERFSKYGNRYLGTDRMER